MLIIASTASLSPFTTLNTPAGSPASENNSANFIAHEGFFSEPGAERGLFFNLYEKYGFLPITTDSHLGEYIQWAYSVADHEAIMEFYDNYKKRCLTFYDDESHYEDYFKNNDKMNERIIPIIEAIIEDSDFDGNHDINFGNDWVYYKNKKKQPKRLWDVFEKDMES